ncbi:hypothetical protein Tco_0838750 [Tanacetum coccineum]|uniref:Uncharacterized protein n=1 Tax=Tanacetum coccineum TaxID=301880 RepID=A0ABQ5ASS7_9ASTR
MELPGLPKRLHESLGWVKIDSANSKVIELVFVTGTYESSRREGYGIFGLGKLFGISDSIIELVLGKVFGTMDSGI